MTTVPDASSCSLYGMAGSDLLDEMTPFNPVTPYGMSKVRPAQALARRQYLERPDLSVEEVAAFVGRQVPTIKSWPRRTTGTVAHTRGEVPGWILRRYWQCNQLTSGEDPCRVCGGVH